MSDTDKYEGHTPGPWGWPKKDSILLKGPGRNKYIITERHRRLSYSIDKEADAQLIADAPLLLAEVKRLRKIIQVQIVTPRSKDFFFQHYGKNDFEERWKEWTDGIQDRVWGRKND